MQTKNIDYYKSLEIWEDRSKTSYTYFKQGSREKIKYYFPKYMNRTMKIAETCRDEAQKMSDEVAFEI